MQTCGTIARTEYIDISKIARILGENICKALPGLHAFTGCDTVSAFAGKGKIKPFKLMQTNNQYQTMFQDLGSEWTLSEDLLQQLQSFVCAMYGAKNGTKEVNQYRYELFCAKRGEAESHQLPPCEDCFKKQCERANYQTAIWKNCTTNIDIPIPIGKGWIVETESGEHNLEIDWMSGLPAPQTVIALMSCKCKKSCKKETCICLQNGINCSEFCSFATC